MYVPKHAREESMTFLGDGAFKEAFLAEYKPSSNNTDINGGGAWVGG